MNLARTLPELQFSIVQLISFSDLPWCRFFCQKEHFFYTDWAEIKCVFSASVSIIPRKDSHGNQETLCSHCINSFSLLFPPWIFIEHKQTRIWSVCHPLPYIPEKLNSLRVSSNPNQKCRYNFLFLFFKVTLTKKSFFWRKTNWGVEIWKKLFLHV